MKTPFFILSLVIGLIAHAQIDTFCHALNPITFTNTGNICDGNDTLIFGLTNPYQGVYMIITLDSNNITQVVDTISAKYELEGTLTFKTGIANDGLYGFAVTTITEDGNICNWHFGSFTVMPCALSTTDIKMEYILPEYIARIDYFTILGQPTEFTPNTLLIEKLTLLDNEVYYRSIIQQ